MRVALDHAAGQQLGIREQLVGALHAPRRGRRRPAGRARRAPRRGSARAPRRATISLISARCARAPAVAPEALVARELGPADRLAEPSEELVAGGRDHDVAVARREGVVGRGEGMLVADALACARRCPRRCVAAESVIAKTASWFERSSTRAPPVRSRSSSAAAMPSAEVEAAHEVGERAAAAHRRSVREARHREQAARRLRHDVVGGLPRARPRRAEARERRDHAARDCAPGSRRRRARALRASPSGSSRPRRRRARTGAGRARGPRACAGRG